MRVLAVTDALPTITNPNTLAPILRQIESLRALGIQVDVLEVKGKPKVKYLPAIPNLYRCIGNVDIVHAHYGYSAWLARSQFNKPVIVSFMGSDVLVNPKTEGLLRLYRKSLAQINYWIAHMVDAVIVKSAEMAEAVKPVKAHIIPNGVDLQTFHPMEARQARAMLGWPDGNRYILFPGNPDNPRKGFSFAQAVISCASEKIGEPLQLVPLHQVAHTCVPLYMNACEAMLMTSFLEGSPNVVKEAMGCNLPVISVPVGDVPELLEGVPGYRVCPRDAQTVAEALVDVLLSGKQHVEGRDALIRKELSLEVVAQKLVGIYTDVLSKRR